MSLWSRIMNVFSSDGLSREIDEEIESNIAEGIEQGRDPVEARRAFGSRLRSLEQCRDIKLLPWLDSVRADAVFGWGQLKKRKAASGAAILSLGLAIGACTSAFRLIDALLLRPLPVANADRLYVVARQGIDPAGNYRISESSEYPLFRQMKAAVENEADLIAISYADRMDLTFGADDDMEKAYRQYVSGGMFRLFELQPAAGRLLTDNDDVTPGAHPYAVLSHDYWTRRFGRDQKVLGQRFRMGNDLYEIVGVSPEGFTGTEPGTVIDVFIPTMMHPFINRSDASWFRPFALLKPNVAVEPVRSKLHLISRAFQEQRAKGWTNQTKQFIDRFLNQTTLLEPAGSRNLRAAAELSRLLDRARNVGRSGASDCLRECSKSDDRSSSGTISRDGAAGFHRGESMASCADGSDRERMARISCGGRRSGIRVVGSAVCG